MRKHRARRRRTRYLREAAPLWELQHVNVGRHVQVVVADDRARVPAATHRRISRPLRPRTQHVQAGSAAPQAGLAGTRWRQCRPSAPQKIIPVQDEQLCYPHVSTDGTTQGKRKMRAEHNISKQARKPKRLSMRSASKNRRTTELAAVRNHLQIWALRPAPSRDCLGATRDSGARHR